jgi:hypothetical protein
MPPGAGANLSVPLPRTFLSIATDGYANSITYSIGYCLVL